MNGIDGGFNLKFISNCGKYEAVYNKYGELLTESNDPVNMGTYNYINYKVDAVSHGIFDVATYELYGNTPNTSAQLFPSTEQYDTNEDAQQYRKEIKNLLVSEIDDKLRRYDEIVEKYT